MWEIFLIGTFAFWTLLAVEFVLLILCTEYEKPILASISLFNVLILLQFMGDVPVIQWCSANPFALVLSVAGYFVIGAVWACVKWWFFVVERRNRYLEVRDIWIAGMKDRITRRRRDLKEWQEQLDKLKITLKNDTDAVAAIKNLTAEIAAYEEVITENRVTDAAKKYWVKYISSWSFGRKVLKPNVGDHKSRIMMWMAWWPFSALWTIINDPIRKLLTYIYNSIKSLLQRISDYVYRDINDDS